MIRLSSYFDQDDKPRSYLTTLVPGNLWDVKEPSHCSKRVGDEVLGVVVYLYLLIHLSFTFMCGLGR